MSQLGEDLGEECSRQRRPQMSSHRARTERRVDEMEGQPVCPVAGGRRRQKAEATAEPGSAGCFVRTGTCSQCRWGQGWGDGQWHLNLAQSGQLPLLPHN